MGLRIGETGMGKICSGQLETVGHLLWPLKRGS